MAATTEKEKLVERDANNSTCLNICACIGLILTITFITVMSMVFLDIQSLDETDANIRLQIEELKRKLEFAQYGDDDEADSRDVMASIAEKYLSEDRSDESPGIHKRQTIHIFDLILKAQEATFEKYCKAPDHPCPPGVRGDNGTNGAAGTDGLNGTSGLVGDKGEVGERGVDGYKGEMGPKGPDGDIGLDGRNGTQGSQGVQGEDGLKGVQGENGTEGAQGKPGMKGDPGDAGLIGPDGQDGVRGSPGFIGPAGDQGLNGTQGPMGPMGKGLSLPAGCECYKKPSFLNPNDETIQVSSITDTQIPCNTTGNPPPVLTLYKPPRKGRKRSIQQNGNIFTVMKAVPSDYGEYICTATNMYGSVDKRITVVGP
ncbi:Leucine rich repeat N-terminal domain [Mactra antiquata]